MRGQEPDEGMSRDTTTNSKFGGTNERDFAQTQAAEASDTSPRRGKKRYNVTVFPHFRDRLACDPLNFFCVYANHDYRWSDTAAEAERSIFALVDSMVAAVRKAFNEALQRFRHMPTFVQQAHALRCVIAIPAAPMASTMLHLYSHGEGVAHHLMWRKSAASFSSTLPVAGSRNDVNATSSSSVGRSTYSRGISQRAAPRDRTEEEDESILKSLLQQWDPPQNGPKCRIVLDIIASRKTLGDDPPNSEPYRLGQKVFGFVKRKYPQEVMTIFVGISDSGVTLVGRDILYPFRITGAAGSKPNTTATALEGIRSNLAGTLASTSPFASVDALGVAASSNVAAMISGLEQVLVSTVPAPRMVTAPPANTDKVDNVRLVVCFPPADITGSVA
ncbi:uncharacterized protein Tco025E_00754 [Trypanosoma conorhini]|uniref:Uncharacterized protein n=1 Tax=Trypanosoma conorhini TaxID=83891 RepID=A0A3R7PY21_9TRYP|nr:uncharacterized protein Tco025E_00754 [Trypanosoma conorhini]RNF26998.1 hypothetical protein Tco025E_00754 [Trypanosoma conorhini]